MGSPTATVSAGNTLDSFVDVDELADEFRSRDDPCVARVNIVPRRPVGVALVRKRSVVSVPPRTALLVVGVKRFKLISVSYIGTGIVITIISTVRIEIQPFRLQTVLPSRFSSTPRGHFSVRLRGH